MTKVTLSDVQNLNDQPSTQAVINNNSAILEAAFDNTLSRDGSSPNTMQSTLDMNSFQIINLPAPIEADAPLRLQDLSSFVGGGTVTNIPAGGTTGQVLGKTGSPDYQVGWENSVTSVGLALPADLTITNSPVTTTGTLTGAWATTPTGTGAMVRATSPTLVTPALGTPASGVATNLTGTAAGLTAGNVTTNANLTGVITSVGNATSIASQTGTGTKFVVDTSPILVTPALGTPSSGVATNLTGTAAGLTSGNVTTNANLTGVITSSGNATSIASQTGTGTKFVTDTSPTLVTPTIGAATATSINKMAITAPATSSTLAVANGKTLTASNTLTLAGTDATTITFQGTDTYVGRGTTDTLTNKTLTSPVFSTIVNTGTLTLPTASDTLVGRATTDTLTNKSIVSTQLTGTLQAGQFPALTGDVTTVAGALVSTIGTNIVTNAKAAQMAAKTVKLNATNALANATDTAISSLTDISTPSSTLDWIMIEDHTAGTIKKTNASELLSSVGSGVTSLNGQSGTVIVKYIPGGRLTLSTGVPVMNATVSAATTVYYTPYIHDNILIYDGTNWIPTVFTELSQATTDTTKSPAAVTTNSNYDIFVWNDSGTIRATRGPAWTSDTARGTGAGTTQLVRTGGIFLNNNSITNGPAASRGTYVGTIRSNGSSQIDWIYGALAVGGTAASFGLWNNYNRISFMTTVEDNTSSWTYASPTYRASNNSNAMRVSFIRGADEDGVVATFTQPSTNGVSTGGGFAGVGLDTTTGVSGTLLISVSLASANAPIGGTYSGLPGLGFHYLQAVEDSPSSLSITFYGNAGVAYIQNGLNVSNIRA